MKVLVVGAGGFVGQQVMAKLAASGDLAPIAGLRRPTTLAPTVETRLLDATDRESVRRAMEGIDAVVNLVMGRPTAMEAATDALLDSSEARKIRRFVQLSSIAVYGSKEGTLDDAASFADELDAYGRSKVASERAVQAAAERGLPSVVLRPGLIHGPGSEAWTARVGRLLVQRRLGDLGAGGDGFANLIGVDEVASAIAAALRQDAAIGGRYVLAPAEPPTWNRYLMDFARAIGATPVHRLPAWQLKLERKLLAPPLKIAEMLAGRLGIRRPRVPDPVTPGLARLFAQELRFSPQSVDRDLAFPRRPYDEALREAANWFRERYPAA